MSYVDDLLQEVSQKVDNQQIQIIEGLFNRISSSMHGLKNLNHYVDLHLDLHRVNKQLNYLEVIDDLTEQWYDKDGNLHRSTSEKVLSLVEKQHKLKYNLYNLKQKAKGFRSLRKEILQELNK